jgi:hypothetical protein
MTRNVSPLQLTHQVSPGNPASGVTSVFAKTGDQLFLRTSAGTERLLEPGVLFAFSKAGTLSVGNGVHRIYNDTGATLTIKGVRASVGTAPTGASIIVDINKGTTTPTTIFTTQANRPTIAASAITSGKVTNMNVTTIADGECFTVDIDQVGSTVPGSDITIQILC